MLAFGRQYVTFLVLSLQWRARDFSVKSAPGPPKHTNSRNQLFFCRFRRWFPKASKIKKVFPSILEEPSEHLGHKQISCPLASRGFLSIQTPRNLVPSGLKMFYEHLGHLCPKRGFKAPRNQKVSYWLSQTSPQGIFRNQKITCCLSRTSPQGTQEPKRLVFPIPKKP